MEAAHTIRSAVDQVSQLRRACDASPALAAALHEIKALQAARFAGTYAEILSGGQYEAPARFFLEELYSDRDYAQRDAQFSRIAGAIETFFPKQVVVTATSLATLHALTEDLDHAMAQVWLTLPDTLPPAARYLTTWRRVGRRTDRQAQLRVVIGIGHDMARITRATTLRLALKMMRAPAAAAGLGSLQSFLEAGFDTFSAMAKRKGAAEAFLSLIEARESELLVALFDAPTVACETELARLLGVAR